MSCAALRREGGFTMVEMIIAIVVLSVGVLALSASATRLSELSRNAEIEALALQAVEDRMARILLHPAYSELDSLYTESSGTIPGLPGYTRKTQISRIVQVGTSGTTDYTVIMVSVEGPALSEPVSRTVVIGAP